MGSSDYYTMLVCENGHVLTDKLENSANDSAFCTGCGARTITACPSCGAKIRGDLIQSEVIFFGHMKSAPKYCPECGAAFPWTASSLQALKELAELDDKLTGSDVETLVYAAKDTLTENPKTQIGAMRLKKILSKAGQATASAARDIIVDIAAESAKRLLMP